MPHLFGMTWSSDPPSPRSGELSPVSMWFVGQSKCVENLSPFNTMAALDLRHILPSFCGPGGKPRSGNLRCTRSSRYRYFSSGSVRMLERRSHSRCKATHSQGDMHSPLYIVPLVKCGYFTHLEHVQQRTCTAHPRQSYYCLDHILIALWLGDHVPGLNLQLEGRHTWLSVLTDPISLERAR